MAGKGDKPRNCFSKEYRDNYDLIYATEKKTSSAWLNSEEYQGYTILDPDGWDRENWEFSFYQEKISKIEFEWRLIRSTANLNIKPISKK